MNNPLQTLLKINMKEIKISDDRNEIKLKDKEYSEHLLNQQHSLLLRQIKLITKKIDNLIKEFVLVDCSIGKKKDKELENLLRNGFYLNNIKYVLFGKSSSQAKEGIICFVKESIAEELNKRITLDIDLSGEMVISKIEAYLKLTMSGCDFLSFVPNIVVIDDYETLIKYQKIKYVIPTTKEFVNQYGKTIKYTDWQVEEGIRDIPLQPFDGMGVHSFETNELFKKDLNIPEEDNVVSFQIRCVGLKGLSTVFDIHRWFKENNIETITDIWGETHDTKNIDCIWTKSQFKLAKYFDSIEDYKNRLKKYNHVIGISKYNKTIKQEKAMFRMNFQYLQALNLTEEKIKDVIRYTKNLYEKIINGDEFYTIKFLGLLDSQDSSDIENANSNYMKAILINPEMVNDRAVNRNIYESLKKKINELKLGKAYVSGRYSFAVGDMVGFMEYACNMEVRGCLEAKQLYNKGVLGTRAVFRSPLVHNSEVNKISFVENELTERWCNHLENVNMFNIKDISFPQAGGEDADGDLNAVTDNIDVLDSVIISPIIIDVQDKITTDKVLYNIDNLVEYHKRTLDSRIGEITNVSSAICNRDDYLFGTELKHKKLDNYVAICRILQGKEIDYIKTGIRFNMSNKIKRAGSKLPYFLIYKYPEKESKLKKIKKKNKKKWKQINEETNGHITQDIIEKYGIIPSNVAKSKSPLNLNCADIENWEREKFLWTHDYTDTTKLLINNDVKENPNVNRDMKIIYREYLSELKQIKEELEIRKDIDSDKKYDGKINRLINQTKSKVLKLPYNKDEIINSCVLTSYRNNYPSFSWIIVGDYIIKNLINNTPKNKSRIIIECDKDDKNAKEFLGKYYKFVDVDKIEGVIN